MEFDGTLSKLQGTLYSLESQGLLNKSDSVQHVVELLQKISENATEESKSKIAFFLVLNTQLSISDKLRDDDFVGLFTNAGSHIEKDYLVTYIYHLNLQPHLFKIVENCHGDIGLELLDVILSKLQLSDFHRDTFGIKHIYQLWESVFVKITKITHKFHLNESKKFWDYFEQIYDFISSVIKMSLSAKGFETFAGLHLYYFFQTILAFVRIQKNPNLTDDPLYEMSTKAAECETQMGDDCLETVFSKISNCLEGLTIDLWMTLSECYFEFDTKNSSQFLIGDTVYCIIEEGRNLNLPQFLSCFAVNKKDLMMQADIEEVCSKVENGETEWFSVLVKHKQALEEESVKCLLHNINLADLDDLNTILTICYEYLIKNESDSIKELFLVAFKKLPDQTTWVKKIFDNYQPNLLQTSTTNHDIVEFFNKISFENTSNPELISLSVQNPFETVKKICEMAKINADQIDFAISLLKTLKQSCSLKMQDGFRVIDKVVNLLLEDTNEKDVGFYVKFVLDLGKENLLEISYFSSLLERLVEFLSGGFLEKALICLKIIGFGVKPELKLVEVEPAPFLVYMAQVLEHFSWNPRGFSYLKAEGRDLACGIVESLMSQPETLDDDKLAWVRQEISKTWEVNQPYFCDLWFSRGLTWTGSGKFHSCLLAFVHTRHKQEEIRKTLIGFGASTELRASVVLSLSVLLPVLTFREWELISDRLMTVSDSLDCNKTDPRYLVLDAFGSAVHIICLHSKQAKEALSCREFCQRNYGRLVKHFANKLKAESLMGIVRKIFFVVHAISDEEERKNVWEMNSAIVLDLIDRMKKKKVLEGEEKEMEELLTLLDLEKVAEAAVEKLKPNQGETTQREE